MKFQKIFIQITKKCNLACNFCTQNTYFSELSRRKNIESKNIESKNEMSTENFQHICKQIKNRTNRVALHILGEPTLHSKFFEILQIAQKFHLKIELTTNGANLKPEIWELLENSSAIFQINFSLTSFLAQSQKTPQKAQLKQYLEPILNFCAKNVNKAKFINLRLWNFTAPPYFAPDSIKFKDSIESSIESSENFKTKFATNPPQNAELLELLADFFKIEQITKISQIPHIPAKSHRIRLSNRVFLDLRASFIWPAPPPDSMAELDSIAKLDSMAKPDQKPLPCAFVLGILPNGEVVSCCFDYSGANSFGNIFEKSLTQILQSKAYKSARNGFLRGEKILALCQNCKIHEF